MSKKFQHFYARTTDMGEGGVKKWGNDANVFNVRSNIIFSNVLSIYIYMFCFSFSSFRPLRKIVGDLSIGDKLPTIFFN